MPMFTYHCRECGFLTDVLRKYDARLEQARCKDCAGLADYTGLCSPAILTDRQIAAHMEDGRRVVGTFGDAPKKFRQRPT